MEPQSKRNSNKKPFAILVFLSFVFVSPAFSQIKHGTIGVIYSSQDKIVMAADSRSSLPDRKDLPPEDSTCKLAALDGDVIFLSSGGTEYRPFSSIDLVQRWTNNEEARIAYQKKVDTDLTAKGHIKQIAEQWGGSIESKFRFLYSVHPEIVIAAAREEKGILTTGVFGGFDSSGKLVLYRTVIPFLESAGSISHSTTDETCDSCYHALGIIDIFNEFRNMETERAKMEAKEWKPEGTDPEVAETMHLVNLTIRYHDGNDVGGAVDAIEISRDGSLRWIARKLNCPEKMVKQ